MTWDDIRYFKPEEFSSPDMPGSGLRMNFLFVAKLDRMRSRCGFPFVITSGYRSLSHNDEVGGKDNSAHLSGHAADILCRSSKERFAIIEAARAEGIRRYGIAANFVHIDDSPVLSQDVVWMY